MAIQYTASDFLIKLSQSNNSYTNVYRKKVRESNENVETLQVDVAGLKKTVKDLGKASKGMVLNSQLENFKIYYKKTAVENKGSSLKTRLEKQFQNLAKTYNSMKTDAEKVSDAELDKQMEKLEKLFDKNERDLKKIGVKKKDGKYVFDSDTFEDADSKVINRLLEGKDSFISQTEKIMRKIETRLVDIQYSTVQRNLMRTTKYDKDEITIAASFIQAKEATEKLSSIGNHILDTGMLSEEEKKEIQNNFFVLINTYDNANNFDNEDCNKLKDLCKEKKVELAKVGITIEEDSDGKKTMKYDKPDFDDPGFQNAYISLFEKDSQFVNDIVNCCNNGFKNTLKPENVGVSIVDVYV